MRVRAGHASWAAVIAILLTVSGGCRAIRRERPPPLPPLRIGTVTDSPPLAFREHRRWLGIEMDLGRALARHLGMRPVLVPLPREQLIPALLDGRVDLLMAGLTITDERRVQIEYSAPYLVVGQSALIRRSELLRFNTDIKIRAARARAAVVEGSAGDRLVADFLPRARRVAFPDLDQAVAALFQGEVDLLVYDAPSLWWIGLKHEPHLMIAPVLFAREEIAWGFRKESKRLRESANQALADWQRDGTLEAILHRWIPFSR